MTGHQIGLLLIGAVLGIFFGGVAHAAYSYTRYRLALRRIRRNVLAYAAAHPQAAPDA